MALIEENAVRTVCAPAANVKGRSWKDVLQPFYSTTTSLNLIQYNLFQFIATEPVFLFSKVLKSTQDFEKFKLAKKKNDIRDVIASIEEKLWLSDSISSWQYLNAIPSAHNDISCRYIQTNIVNGYFSSVDGLNLIDAPIGSGLKTGIEDSIEGH